MITMISMSKVILWLTRVYDISQSTTLCLNRSEFSTKRYYWDLGPQHRSNQWTQPSESQTHWAHDVISMCIIWSYLVKTLINEITASIHTLKKDSQRLVEFPMCYHCSFNHLKAQQSSKVKWEHNVCYHGASSNSRTKWPGLQLRWIVNGASDQCCPRFCADYYSNCEDLHKPVTT